MGCCSSSASANQVKEPERVVVHKEEYVEDVKEGDRPSQRQGNPAPIKNAPQESKPSSPLPRNSPEKVPEDLMRRQSSKIDLSANIKASPNGKITAIKQEYGENKEKNRFLDPGIKNSSRRESPDVYKQKSIEQINGVNHLSINGVTESKEGRFEIKTYETRNRLQSEDSTFKISREQHEEILRFVTEKKKNVQNALDYLYHNLTKNLKEDDKLAFIVEDLKSWSKDIENCIDDLMTYWFENDHEFKMELIRNSELVKNIVFEFGTLKKNLTPYRDFRERLLIILKDFDSNIANKDLASYRSTRGYSAKERREEVVQASIAFIPREETQEYEDHHRNMVEDQIDLRLEIK